MKLKDKIVLISGASAGIGAALAVQIARLGARAVVLLARSEAALATVAEGVRAQGAQALAVPCDVGQAAQVDAAIASALAAFGRIDVVIANAGIGSAISPLRPDQAAVERVMEINFLGATRLIHAALPQMVARGSGHIVGVSSLAGYRGMARGAAYCSSKAALTTFLESYRVELAPHGIEVTTVLPGYVETELVKRNQVRPLLALTTEDAARIITRGMEAGRAAVRFPTLTALLMLMVRFMPPMLFDRAMRAFAAEKLKLPPPQAG